MQENKKTRVYAVHSNREDFIRWQAATFARWMKVPYELVVVNNADTQEQRDKITKEAQLADLEVFYTKSNRDLPGFKHADALKQLWLDAIKHKDKYVMVIDGDIFLFGEFDIEKCLCGAPMAGCKQQREYLWHWLTPIVMMFDMEKIPEPETIDWEGGAAPNGTRMDVAGNLFYYLEKYPEVKEKVKDIGHTWHLKQENNNLHVLPDEVLSKYKEHWNLEIFGRVFLHYCRSSNWDGQTQEHHKDKTDFVTWFLSEAMTENIKAKNIDFFCDNDTYFGWGKK